MLKFFLLQIFCRRNCLHHIAQFIQGIHDHVRAGRLQQAGIGKGYLHMHALKSRFLGLFQHVLVAVIKLQVISACRSRRCLSGSRRCRSGTCCRSRCSLPLGNRRQLGHQVGDINQVFRVTVAHVINHLLQRIKALKQGIDDIFRQLQLLLANKIQHVLHLMGEFSNLVEAHGGRHAFEGVRVAEDFIDYGNILGIFFETQQAVIQRL